jgi:hemolysin activation/secretion protein
MGGKGDSKISDKTFFKVTAGATRVQRLFGRSLGIVRVNGQYSPNDLYPAEQMQLGGPYTLRGFQPAEIIGDYGVSGTVEYRFPIPFFNRIAPKLDERIRLAAFYDFGWIGENTKQYNYPDKFLHSVGFGTYITFFDWLTTQIGVGFPLSGRHYSGCDARFYFSVNGDLDRILPLRNPEKL